MVVVGSTSGASAGGGAVEAGISALRDAIAVPLDKLLALFSPPPAGDKGGAAAADKTAAEKLGASADKHGTAAGKLIDAGTKLDSAADKLAAPAPRPKEEKPAAGGTSTTPTTTAEGGASAQYPLGRGGPHVETIGEGGNTRPLLPHWFDDPGNQFLRDKGIWPPTDTSTDIPGPNASAEEIAKARSQGYQTPEELRASPDYKLPPNYFLNKQTGKYENITDADRQATGGLYGAQILPGQDEAFANAPVYGPGGLESGGAGAGGGFAQLLQTAGQVLGNAAQTFAQAVSQDTGKPVAGGGTAAGGTPGALPAGELPATGALPPQPRVASTPAGVSGAAPVPVEIVGTEPGAASGSASSGTGASGGQDVSSPTGWEPGQGEAQQGGDLAGQLATAVDGLNNAGTALSDLANAMNEAASAISDAASRFTSPGHATGGLIHGPGTATSDSVPAWLSHGEYVVSAPAVQKYGVGVMHAINQLKAPTMQLGGLVQWLESPRAPLIPGFGEGGIVDLFQHFDVGGVVARITSGIHPQLPSVPAQFGSVGGTKERHLVDLRTNAGDITGLSGGPDVVDQLHRASTNQRIAQIGRSNPSWRK